MSQMKGIWPQMTPRRMVYYTRNWSRSGLAFGTAGAIAVAFAFDWKYVLKYVPFINTKWKTD